LPRRLPIAGVGRFSGCFWWVPPFLILCLQSTVPFPPSNRSKESDPLLLANFFPPPSDTFRGDPLAFKKILFPFLAYSPMLTWTFLICYGCIPPKVVTGCRLCFSGLSPRTLRQFFLKPGPCVTDFPGGPNVTLATGRLGRTPPPFFSQFFLNSGPLVAPPEKRDPADRIINTTTNPLF